MSGLVRDYTLVYKVDTTQATPGFIAIRNGLDMMENHAARTKVQVDLLDQSLVNMGTAATGAAGHLNNVGTAAAGGSGLATMVTHALAMGAAFKALEFAVDVVTSIGEATNKARAKMKEMAEETIKLRQEMRELATLQGKDGPDDQVMAGAVESGLKMGMTPKQATRYLEQFLGSNPAGLQKHNIGDGIHQGETQEQYEKRVAPISEQIAVEGGRLGQRVKLDPKTAGDLAGVLSQYGRVKDGKDAAQQMGRIVLGLQMGRGNLEPLMRSMINTAGAVVDDGNGPVASPEELAVIQGVMSTHKNPRESGTYTRTAIRALRKFGDKQGDALRGLGIDETTSHLEALQKVAAHVKQTGRPIDAALRGMGFTASEDIESLTMEIKDVDIIDERLKLTQEVTGEKVQALNKKFFTQELAGHKLKQDAQKEAQAFVRGQAMEPFQMARVQATTRKRDEGTLMGPEQILADKIQDAGGIMPSLGIPDAFTQRIDEDALNALVTGAEQVGLGDRARQLRQEVLAGGPSGYEQREAAMFAELTPKILKRGGNPFGGAGGTEAKVREIGLEEATRAKRESARLPRPGGKPGPRAPIPQPPPGLNLGDAFGVAPASHEFDIKPDIVPKAGFMGAGADMVRGGQKVPLGPHQPPATSRPPARGAGARRRPGQGSGRRRRPRRGRYAEDQRTPGTTGPRGRARGPQASPRINGSTRDWRLRADARMSLPPDSPRKKFATIGEAAAFAGVSPRTIRRQIQAGRLPAHRLGRRTLIVLATLDALITSSGAGAMSQEPRDPEPQPSTTGGIVATNIE